MKITLLTYGSQGDVEPFVVLGKGLIQAGHQVILAAPKNFEFLVNIKGIEFVGFPGNPQQMVQDLVDRAGNNWWRMVTSLSSFVLPLGLEVSQKAREACRDADLVVHSFLMTNTGYEIARENGIPDISAQTFPVFASTGAFPAPVAPDLPLGGLYRRFTHGFVTQTFWQGSRIIYRAVRKKNPELPLLTGWPFDPKNDWQTPILYAFSPQIIPRPADWGENVHITGYWFSDDPVDWTPSDKLLDFIKNGSPPIAVVFGSTVTKKFQGIREKIQEALEISGQRGIFVGDKSDPGTSSRVFYQTDYTPYEWLFERSTAVIHHGGAGTTGKALRAGLPNIVVPFTSDQPFWGRRVYKLGAGPKPISPRKLSAAQLAQAIDSTINDQEIRSRVETISQGLRNENGAAQAIKIIHDIVEKNKDVIKTN